MRTIGALLTVLAILCVCPVRAAEPRAGETALVFGVVPQQSALELVRSWAPLLTYLGKQTGQPLRFETAKDIPTFEQRLAAGQYDLAYMNPYHYVVFQHAPGYRVFAKEKDRLLKGIVVVRKDSALHDIAELRGKTVAFPGPAAFAASVLPQAELHERGIPITVQYVSSHESVYLSVVRGFFPAGGGVERTFERLDPALREQLHVLWATPAYTPHAIAAHPRVPRPTVDRLQAAMRAMADDPEGAALLKAAGFSGLVPARDADYDDIRRLDLKQLAPPPVH